MTNNDIKMLLQPGIQGVIDGIVSYLSEESRESVLGPEIDKYAKGGTGKTLVTLACFSDGLRVVYESIFADGESSEEEINHAKSFISLVAKAFTRVRSDYYGASSENVPSFLELYREDNGPFGLLNTSTKWAGIQICINIADQFDDKAPFNQLYKSLIGAAEALLSADGMTDEEHVFLDRLRVELGGTASEIIENQENNISEDKLLTKEIVEQYKVGDTSIDLYEFTMITDEAAEALKQKSWPGGPGQEGPDLSSLISLSDTAAKHLSTLDAILFLDNENIQISDEAIRSLSMHKRDLFLGVKHLSDLSAEYLSNKEGPLYLEDLEILSPAAARSLAKHPNLYVDTDAWPDEAAEAYTLSISTITKETVEQFLEDEDSVDLSEFVAIEDAAAESLSKYQSGFLGLSLPGLTSLSDAAAESLSKHQGGLSLSGLTKLSNAVAESLSKHQGGLDLSGLTSLSDAAAESLSKHQGRLSLSGLTKLSNAVAEKLSKHKGAIALSGLTSLSDEAAESLSKHQGVLVLSGLASLSDAAAESLSKHQGELALYGLTSLSDAAVESLSKHQGGLAIGLTSLSDQRAEVLSSYNGYLNFEELKHLSDPAAYHLSKHRGGLELTSLRCLSNSPGHLALVRTLSMQENIELISLEFLSDAAAELLSNNKNKDGYIDLSNIKFLSDIAGEHLRKYEGELYLDFESLMPDFNSMAEVVEYFDDIDLIYPD